MRRLTRGGLIAVGSTYDIHSLCATVVREAHRSLEAPLWQVQRRLHSYASSDKLKAKQVEAVEAFLGGSDTFVSLPTGYGKSIIYSVLPYAFDKLRGTTQ